MRVALINVVYKKGSTGQIVSDLKDAYIKDGHDVYVLYGRGAKVDEAKVYKTGYEIESKFCHALAKISGNLYGGMWLSTLRLKRYLKKINPDVVHLHCLNGFFANLYSVIKFLKKRNVKVILTNHADFMFTANCGFSLDCTRWKTNECRGCPRVKEFNGNLSLNRTHHFYKKMERAFKGAKNFILTGVSPHLTGMLEQSPIFKDIPIVSVNNGFNLHDFLELDDYDPYKDIRSDEQTKIVLHVTSGFHLPDKGGDRLYLLAEKYKDENVKFVVIGNMHGEKSTKNIIFKGRASSRSELLSYYRHADATVIFSKFETFSMIVGESLLLGTPVVGFLAGGPESVAPKKYTRFVKQGDIESFKDELDQFLNSKIDHKDVIEDAKKVYDIELSKNNYEVLFEDKGNKPKKSFIHKIKDKISKLSKSKKMPLISSIVLFSFFLLFNLASIISGLYSSQTIGLIYRLVVFGLFALTLLFLTLALKSRAHFLFGSILIIYLLLGIVISFTDIISSDFSLITRLSNFARTFGVFVFVFAFMEVLPFVYKDKSTVRYFGILVGLFAFIAILYTYIFQSSVIINSFIAEGENAHFYQVTSFFTSKNAYGSMLMFGMIGITYALLFYKGAKRTLLAVSDAFLFLNLIISRDKTALVIVLLMSLAILVYIFVSSYKKHFKRNTIILSIVLSLLVIFVLFLSIDALHPSGSVLDKIHHYIYQNFIINGLITFTERFKDFARASDLINTPLIVLGYGEQFVYSVYGSMTGISSIDNSYLATLLSGGLIKAMLLIYIYYMFISRLILLFKENKKIALFILGVILMFTLQGLMENISYLSTGASAIFMFVFSYLITTSELSSNLIKKEKRVLHVVASFKKGGTEAFILGYIKLLKSRGITFDIYSFGEVDKSQEEKVKLYGGKVYRGSAPSRRNYFKAKRDFVKFIRNHNDYIAVHANANFDNSMYLSVAKDYLVSKRLSHAHDTLTGIKFSRLEKIIMFLKRFSMKVNATDYVACSYEAGYDIFGQSFFDEYGVIVRNIVDKDKFLGIKEEETVSLRKEYDIPDDAFIVGNISRFEPKKNQEYAVDVFVTILKNKSNSILILGGPDGGTLEEIKNKVKRLDIESKVRFIGARSDVPLWLKILDLYLFPSKFEGFGIVVLENQIAGLRTVASSVVPKIVDIHIGLVDFVALGDTETWAAYALDISKEKISVKRITQALKEAHFELDENAGLLAGLYH
jgi:glycosyltransferase involved in cell wall biosynthesis/O-antigen ligase